MRKSAQLIEQVKDTVGKLETNVEDDGFGGVPVCGANTSSPVIDQAYYIDEITYRIGGKIYVENAPHDVSPRTGLP